MDIRVTQVTYTKRFNTGEYEFEEYSVVADVDGEKASHVISELKEEVLAAHIDGKIEKEESNEQCNSKKSNKDRKSAGKKDKGSDDEGAEDNESAEHEASDDDHDNAEGAEGGEESESVSEAEAAEVEEVEEKKPSKGKGASKGKDAKDEGKKSFKRKPSAYDRSIEAHKEHFSSELRLINPKWKDSEESKKKAKKASEKLEGQPFLDENGEILESFKAQLKKLVK